MRSSGSFWFLLSILCALACSASAEPPDPPRSGLEWATPAIRAMQADDFGNPALFWLERGEALFAEPDGQAEKACADCHTTDALGAASARYPRVVEGEMSNLGMQVNRCRQTRMQTDALPPESEELLSLTLFLRNLAAGRPVDISIDGQARPWFERGKALYHQRRGQMNLACAQCHDDRAGLWVRGEQLSQGQINNFPAYLLRWSGVGSTHRRFRFCDDQRIAEPLPIGSPDYLALELYVAWRGNGLPVEAPAVRR